jgi:hypothetical protein
MGERRGSCRALVGKPEGMRPFGRPRCRLKIVLRRFLGSKMRTHALD